MRALVTVQYRGEAAVFAPPVGWAATHGRLGEAHGHPAFVAHESFAHAGGTAGDDDDLDAAAVELGDLFNDGAEAGEGGVA